MKGDPKVLEMLNKGVAIELTAINQYFLHARMCENWGYGKLAKKLYEEALGEMKHAQFLIDRLLFLEGTPNMSAVGAIAVGANVKQQLENDLKLEMGAVKAYNAGIDVCNRAKDNASRELLEHILVDSEEHVDWLETQLHVVDEVGLQNYLTEQIGTGEKKD